MKNIKSEVFNKNEKSLVFEENDKKLKNEESIEKLEIHKNSSFEQNINFHEINNNEENINIHEIHNNIGINEISYVPYSNEVDYATFSRVLSDSKVVATYKMYWLLGLLDEAAMGNVEISFRKLISRMITYAWYPILAYKLSFGLCDNLVKVVNYIADTYNLGSNYNEKKLLEFIYNNEDKTLTKMMKDLTYNVPYRFLSPFFQDKLKGETTKVEKIIEELSKESKTCVYSIYRNEDNESYIRINNGWGNYLKYNYKIIQGWAYYKLVCFLQKRNPNTPGIAMKLEAPKSRNLTAQTAIWKEIIQRKHIVDIYTDKEFIDDNYKLYGVLSLDHFIPWSFVLHDQMWNLVPTFKNINSKKNDNLLDYDTYIDKFCNIQYEAFSFVVNTKKKNQIEEYREMLKIADPKRFLERESKEVFFKMIKKEVYPVYNIAVNQGFGIVTNLF
ncbi:MAG: HNH endonuclease domain-containing protein [Clostridium neonatale]|uniref:HNH endonuclease domain-containing protein n=1 Tax=Clostridium neonatale TaxID=137838 RepID=UPI001DBC9530|nr:HNH endonuclease domain-containing protein [Clostridium neonatale]CAG9713388.1 HNH endonuclease [Clostridium neonatale]CAI3546534.1 HNHc domain-containing protein [Clostridium neonatale]CAI3719061.1 HNHc domain-containing protein [Clostridium neonatale]